MGLLHSPTRGFRPVLLSLVLALAACATPPDSSPAPQPDGPPTPAPAPQTEPAREPEPEPVPKMPLPKLQSLFGKPPAALADVLGEPALKRVETAVELWQYRGGGCVLALYLYEEKAGGAHTVSHVEARSAKGTRVETEACFHALLSERR